MTQPRRSAWAAALAAAQAALTCLVWAALGACGACQDPGHPSEPDAGADAQITDARPRADVAPFPDARIPDATLPDALVIQHDFCDQAFFKLPIDGQTEQTNGIDIDRGRVVWTRSNDPAMMAPGEIHLLDLQTCLEEQVTVGAQASWVDLRGEDLVWTDWITADATCTDLKHLDLSTGITDSLTDTPECEFEARSNGRFVVYRWSATLNDVPTLRVLDMETSESTEIWPGPVDSYDIGDRYVVWPGYGPDPQSVGRDVYAYDLQSGETRHLDFTYDRYQWWVFVWQGWVTIRGTDYGLYDPLDWLQLYNLDTGELRELVQNDYATSAAWIGQDLLSYNTSQYSASPALNPSDIEIYEIDSGLTRRLTTAQSNLRATGVASPYLLFIHRLFDPGNSFKNDFYVANLNLLGVLDASGNLVPGDPVITPPPLAP